MSKITRWQDNLLRPIAEATFTGFLKIYHTLADENSCSLKAKRKKRGERMRREKKEREGGGGGERKRKNHPHDGATTDKT